MGWEMILVPFILAGLGGLLTEKAGRLNIALEGLMGLGAFTAAVMALVTGNWFLALGAALGAGLLGALFQGWTLRQFQTDNFITGLAFNLLWPAITAMVSQTLFSTKGALRVEGAWGRWEAAWTLAVAAPLVCVAVWFLLTRTPWGLRLRAAGVAPDLARHRGLKPENWQLGALILSGGLSALAGAHLALRLGAYLSGLSAGRGWIALVALYLGGKHPIGLLAASALFAGAEILSQNLQGFIPVPESVVLALPYLITLAALTTYGVTKKKSRNPGE